jgi:signal peptidase I
MLPKPRIKSIIIIISIILLAWYISNYWLQFTLIQGDSMLPTYHNMQLVFVDKHTTVFDYGDIVIFQNSNLKSTLIKRVIACPGDTVQISEGILYINEKPSPLIPETTRLSYAGIASSKLTLSDDEYFVLGDNYEASKDSRYEEVGLLHTTDILGKVID